MDSIKINKDELSLICKKYNYVYKGEFYKNNKNLVCGFYKITNSGSSIIEWIYGIDFYKTKNDNKFYICVGELHYQAMLKRFDNNFIKDLEKGFILDYEIKE